MATLIQSTGDYSTSDVASIAKAYASDVTSGNAIIQTGGELKNAHGVISDDKSNSYTVDESTTTGVGASCQITSCLSAAAGATTVTYTCDTTGRCVIGISEWSGIATSDAVDVDDVGNQAWGTTLQTAQVSTTEADVCIAACHLYSVNASWVSHPTGYSNLYTGEPGVGNMGISFYYKIQGSSGNEQPDWEWGSDSIGVGCIVAYKMAAGAGGSVVPIILQQMRRRRA